MIQSAPITISTCPVAPRWATSCFGELSPPTEHHRKWNETWIGEWAHASATLRHPTARLGMCSGQTSALDTPRRTAAAQAQEAQRTTQDRLRVVLPAQKAGLTLFADGDGNQCRLSAPVSPQPNVKVKRYD
jgi:hypothetical protein